MSYRSYVGRGGVFIGKCLRSVQMKLIGAGAILKVEGHNPVRSGGKKFQCPSTLSCAHSNGWAQWGVLPSLQN